MYFCTLSVENCGASGSPMMRSTPLAARSLIAAPMYGCQFRMPTATGTSGPSRFDSASACASVSSVSGDPPIAR